MGTGSIIFLNGASSSGKTTIGRELQRQMDRPFLYLSPDQLVEAKVLPRIGRDRPDGIWAWGPFVLTSLRHSTGAWLLLRLLAMT